MPLSLVFSETENSRARHAGVTWMPAGSDDVMVVGKRGREERRKTESKRKNGEGNKDLQALPFHGKNTAPCLLTLSLFSEVELGSWCPLCRCVFSLSLRFLFLFLLSVSLGALGFYSECAQQPFRLLP
jgi:hypothetical protein